MTPVKYATQIAMHPDDSGRIERADRSWNLKPKPDKFGLLVRVVALFIRPGEFDTFGPGNRLDQPGHGKPFRLNQVTGNR